MCEFISWIEIDDKVLFLDDARMKEKERKMEVKYPDKSEWQGHGAIRWYYGIADNNGVKKECINFSSPANFPPVIAEAIKNNQMTYGYANYRQLLNKRGQKKLETNADWRKAYADREKADAYREKTYADHQKAWAAWKKAYADHQKAYADREKANAVYEKAYAVCEKVWAAWKKADAVCEKANAIREKAEADHQKAWAACQKANADWQDITQKLCWSLFADVNSRAEGWK